MTVQILTTREEIEPYLESIQRAGDSERNAFGFLMPGAYREFVQQRRAVLAIDANRALAGYCLYGGACPQAKIFQTYVAPQLRGHGIGARLLETVFKRLESNGFLSVVAKVASDLVIANRFYEKLGFDVVATRAGGKSRDRLINVRARELATPSLLEMFDAPAQCATSVAFHPPLQDRSPLYVLDLNVIFDVTKRRPRSEVTRGVIAAAFENDVRLAVTTELIDELERHSPKNKPDPILELCRALPTLRLPSDQVLSEYRSRLRQIVFPEKVQLQKMKRNDEADLRHLSTAIVEGAAGFITSDEAILRASSEIEGLFRLSLLSPSTFGQGFGVEFGGSSKQFVATADSFIERAAYQLADQNSVRDLLDQFHLSERRQLNLLAAGTATAPRRREVIRADGRVICFASWDAPAAAASQRELHIFADEAHPDASLAIKNMLERACRDVGNQTVSVFSLRSQLSQRLVRTNAISFGFHAGPDEPPRNPMLRKACLGKAVTPETWPQTANNIERCIGLRIEGMPSIKAESAFIVRDFQGARSTSTLVELEKLLSPAIICADDRPGVIFPIWPAYAEELFQGGRQPNFLDQKVASLKPVRAYIGGSYSSVPDEGLAFFYESAKNGGRKAVIAVARLTKRYAMPKERAQAISADRGVLPCEVIDQEKRSRLVTISEFESLMQFKNPVALERLRDLGCADGANFVTSKRISPSQCASLIREGLPHLG